MPAPKTHELPEEQTITFYASYVFNDGEDYNQRMKSIRVRTPIPETFSVSNSNNGVVVN